MALLPLPTISSPVTLAVGDDLRINAQQLSITAGISEGQRKAMCIMLLVFNHYNETGSTDYWPSNLADGARVLNNLLHDARNLTQGYESSEFWTLLTAIIYGSAYAEAADEGGTAPPSSVETLVALVKGFESIGDDDLWRMFLLMMYRCIEEEGFQ